MGLSTTGTKRLHEMGRLRLAFGMVGILAAAPLAAQASAQDSTSALPATRVQATRPELEAELARARADGDSETVALLETRLRDGDIQAGDAIVISVVADSQLSDTFAVRPGRVLSLPRLADIPVSGLLRSELEPYLTEQLGKYLKNPEVEATALVRIAVSGAVNNPGFYNVPAEIPATQALMLTGGLAGGVDLSKASLERGSTTVMSRDEVAEAFRRGASLDQMNVQSGDEFEIGRSRDTWQTIGLFSGLAFGLTALIWRIAD